MAKAKFNVYLHPNLLARLDQWMAQSGLARNTIVEDAIRWYLDRGEPAQVRNQFAQQLGFTDWEALVTASTPVVTENELHHWLVGRTPGGNYVAWDDCALNLAQTSMGTLTECLDRQLAAVRYVQGAGIDWAAVQRLCADAGQPNLVSQLQAKYAKEVTGKAR